MTVSVEYKPSLDYLSRVEGSFGIHSRYDRNHYKHCRQCYTDHLDLMEQCRIDSEEDN